MLRRVGLCTLENIGSLTCDNDTFYWLLLITGCDVTDPIMEKSGRVQSADEAVGRDMPPKQSGGAPERR
jgi:hypothetical protein